MKKIVALVFGVIAVGPVFGQGAGYEDRFRQWDRDGSGRISEEEFQGRPDLFRRIDADKDGSISFDEVTRFAEQQARVRPGEERVEPTVIVGDIPEKAPITESSCRAAAEYSATATGYSVLVMHGGKTVFEQYDAGWNPNKTHRLASGTKSFAGVMAAAAVEDGLISSFDEKVSKTITEWAEDEGLKEVTVRQLLTLTSGIDVGDNGNVPAYADAVADADAVHAPGEKFAYGPVPFQVFGELMRRKLKGQYEIAYDYLDARIFQPIGLSYTYWRVDENGQRHVPSGAFLTAREWVKFGELLRLGGRGNGEQVVSRELLESLVKGTEQNPIYGTTFWLLSGDGETGGAPGAETSEVSDAPSEVLKGGYMAAGAGKQRLFIIPEAELVVVRQGETKGRAFDNGRFLQLLLGQEEEG